MTTLQQANRILQEAKRVQIAFKNQSQFHWGIEDCIKSLKDQMPFCNFHRNAFNNAIILSQKFNKPELN